MSDAKAIEAVRAKWPVLFNEGRIDELGEWFYADDAYALPPGEDAIRSRKKIVDYFKGVRESGQGVRFELAVIETVASGDIGYLVGTYVFTSNGKSVKGTTHEAYRRERDGRWRCVVDMWHNAEPS